MDRFIRQYATFGLLTTLLGCGYRPTVELPDNPVPPPPEAILPVTQEIEHQLSPHSQYEFNLPSVDGEMVSSSEFLGSVVIADIWGTWCGPCRMEVPHLVQLRSEYGERGLEIVGLTYERAGDGATQAAQIRQFIDEQEINYPCLIGDAPTRDQVPGFRGYPTKVFIDRQGGVRLTLVGAQSYEKLEELVTKLLEED